MISYKDDVIREYEHKFGELPPNDMFLDYYSDNYIKLMENAIMTNHKITEFDLNEIIDDNKYDYVRNGGASDDRE